MNDIFQYIDTHRDRFIDELCTLLRQPSISAQNVGMTECAELVRRLMSEVDPYRVLTPAAARAE